MASEATDGAAPAGYKSEGARNEFRSLTKRLGAGAFIVQGLLPLLQVFILTPVMLFCGIPWFEVIDVGSAVAWQGSVWFVRDRHSPDYDFEGVPVLARMGLRKGAAAVDVSALDWWHPDLLPADNRLWLVGRDGLGYYKDGEFNRLRYAGRTEDISAPGLYHGEPIVASTRPDGTVLLHLHKGRWVEGDALPIVGSPRGMGLRLLSVGDSLHLFASTGTGVRHCVAGGDVLLWRRVTSDADPWCVVVLEGRPTVVGVARAGEACRVVAHQLGDDGKWKSLFEHPAGSTRDLGACVVDEPSRLLMFLQGSLGSRILEYRPGEELAERRLPGSFWLGRWLRVLYGVPFLFGLLAAVALAFALTAAMNKYRVADYAVDGRPVTHASLWRRALAHVADILVIAIPMLLLGVASVFCFASLASVADSKRLMVLVISIMLPIAAVLWAVICLVGFSIMEGRGGRTPGKWLLGIRVVGVDLRPCGVWRALLRNFLRFADAFCYYWPGLMLAASSVRQQRLGDRAARTIVVREARRGGSPDAGRPEGPVDLRPST